MRLHTILRRVTWALFVFANLVYVLLKKILRYFVIFMFRASLFIAQCFHIKLDRETEMEEDNRTPIWLANNPKISGPVSLTFKAGVSNVELSWFTEFLDKNNSKFYSSIELFTFIFNLLTGHKLSRKKFLGICRYLTIL